MLPKSFKSLITGWVKCAFISQTPVVGENWEKRVLAPPPAWLVALGALAEVPANAGRGRGGAWPQEVCPGAFRMSRFASAGEESL